MFTTLILGGARSGKSSHALALAESLLGATGKGVFLATAEARDSEMSARIERHRQERSSRWNTLEEPVSIVARVHEHAAHDTVILVDCLTLWLSNLLEQAHDPEPAAAALAGCCEPDWPGHLVLVSNEVGLGLVPPTLLGRQFRDAQGRLNVSLAAAAHRVDFIAAGLPIVLKGASPTAV